MNAGEMIAYDIIRLFIFAILWWLIAKYFYPHYSKKVALDIMDDVEYVYKTQQIQEAWMHTMVAKVVNKAIVQINASIQAIEIDSDTLLEGTRKWFPAWFQGWYGNLVKADNTVQREQDAETEMITQYTQMNKGKPEAINMIKQWAIKRNPNMAFLINIAEQLGDSDSRSPPERGGGY